MFKLKVLAICALAVVVLFSGIALAQDKAEMAKERIIGFGSGTGFGSGGGFGSGSRAIDGFGGSMSSRGLMNMGYGFGSGFRSGTNSGPMSRGDAWSTNNTNTSTGGWQR